MYNTNYKIDINKYFFVYLCRFVQWILFRIQVRRWLGLLVLNYRVTLDGIMFDNLIFSPFVVVFVRAKASIRPHILDVFVMQELAYRTYNHKEMDGVVWVAPRLVLVCLNVKYLHATCQCYEEVLMGGNPTMCSFCRILFLLGKCKVQGWVGGWCSVRKGWIPGACICLLLIQWIHAAMYLSYWPHVDMVRWW